MLSPYENIIIGNFLYGLGLAMGRKPERVDACVTLAQQTPLDAVLGDVMLQFTGAWRLIEFKRVGADLSKELVKLHMFRGATSKNRNLQKASLRAHWFVETGQHVIDALDNSEFKMLVRPYLELESHGGISLEEFTRQVADDAHAPEIPTKDFDLYLRLIKLLGGMDRYEKSGLLVGFSESGGLVYMPLEDITDLKSTGKLLCDRLRTREAEFMAKEVSRQPFSPAVHQNLLERTHELTLTREAVIDRAMTR